MAAFTIINHTEIGSGGAASWNVTSIPASYDHLYIKASLRISNSNEDCDMKLRLNGDTGTNYSTTGLYGYSLSIAPDSNRQTGQTGITYLNTNGDNSTNDTFGNMDIWIPHYSNTANFKCVLSHHCVEGATTTNYDWREAMAAGVWADTSAIDEVTLFEASAYYLLMQYSTVTLYGVSGA